jgi:hypothetical protein
MRNEECNDYQCKKSAAVICFKQGNQGNPWRYCTEHFLAALVDVELTEIKFLPTRGADLEPA